jgi:hypothetical protein
LTFEPVNQIIKSKVSPFYPYFSGFRRRLPREEGGLEPGINTRPHFISY